MEKWLLVRMWQLLHRVPVASPLARYARLTNPSTQSQKPARLLSRIFTIIILLILIPVAAFVVVPLLVREYADALGYLVVLLPALYTLYGATLVAVTVTGIQREIAKRTYDLLCATPLGRFGVHRTFAAHEVALSGIYRQVIYGVMFVGIAALWGGAGDEVIFDIEAPTLFNALLRALVLSLFFALDYAYSLAQGGMIGMIMPAAQRDITLPSAISAYVGVQSAIYAAALMVIGALRAVIGGLFDPALADALLAVGALAFYITLRELLTLALWRALARELNAPETGALPAAF